MNFEIILPICAPQFAYENAMRFFVAPQSVCGEN